MGRLKFDVMNLDRNQDEVEDRYKAGWKPEQRKKKPQPKEEKERNAFQRFFKRFGYSVWLLVMAVGGIIAFVISLFLL